MQCEALILDGICRRLASVEGEVHPALAALLGLGIPRYITAGYPATRGIAFYLGDHIDGFFREFCRHGDVYSSVKG